MTYKVKINFKILFVIFHSFAQTSRRRICTKFGTQIWVSDVTTCDKYLSDLRGVDSVVGQMCPFPLTRPVTVNTGLALLCSP